MHEHLKMALEVMNILNKNNFEAYMVGGFVRDYLLKMPSKDIDITTNALPEDIKRIFDKTILVGAKFNTVIVNYKNHSFEVTTYRIESDYKDYRHPSNVEVARTLAEDLERRDFTINTICLDKDLNVVDLLNGKYDLIRHLIRCVGEANVRFEEDALRILRAIRFAAKLQFMIEPKTLKAMKSKSKLIKHISIERVMNELKGVLSSDHTDIGFSYFLRSGLDEIFPDLKESAILLSNKNFHLSFNQFFGLSLYLHGDFETEWRFSNEEYKEIRAIDSLLPSFEEGSIDILNVYSYGAKTCLIANRVGLLLGYKDLSNLINKMDQELPIHKTCDLKFKGQDLIDNYKFEDARKIGDLVEEIKFKVINKELENDYEKIKEYVDSIIDNFGASYEK